MIMITTADKKLIFRKIINVTMAKSLLKGLYISDVILDTVWPPTLIIQLFTTKAYLLMS